MTRKGPAIPQGKALARSPGTVEVVTRKEQAGVISLRLRASTSSVVHKVMYADYVRIAPNDEGVQIIFGKRDPFSTPDRLSLINALEVSIPKVHFCSQVYKSVTVTREGKASFVETVKQTVTKNGYPKIDSFAPAVSAEKKAGIRAIATLMAIFEDDACLDLFHIDAMAMRQAALGLQQQIELDGVVRIVMAPNLLLYLVEQIIEIGAALLKANPDLEREIAEEEDDG